MKRAEIQRKVFAMLEENKASHVVLYPTHIEALLQVRRYADAGPEMERLLRVARLILGSAAPAVREQISDVLKAVQPKKEKR